MEGGREGGGGGEADPSLKKPANQPSARPPVRRTDGGVLPAAAPHRRLTARWLFPAANANAGAWQTTDEDDGGAEGGGATCRALLAKRES